MILVIVAVYGQCSDLIFFSSTLFTESRNNRPNGYIVWQWFEIASHERVGNEDVVARSGSESVKIFFNSSCSWNELEPVLMKIGLGVRCRKWYHHLPRNVHQFVQAGT